MANINQWKVGDIISASRLNEMVTAINNLLAKQEVDPSNFITTEQLTTILAGYSDVGHTHNISEIVDLVLPTVPTKLSQLENDTDFTTVTQVNQAIANAQLGGSQGTVDLSSYAKKTDLPTKTSQLQNDSGYVTDASVDEKVANAFTKEIPKANILSIVLGNYEIKYNSTDDTLDFIFNGVIDEPEVPTTEEIIPLTWAVGNLSETDGSETEQASALRSSFATIEDNYNYSFYLSTSMSDPTGGRIYFYDTNKTFISRTNGYDLGYTTGTDIPIDIPSNAVYMRFKFNVDSSTTLDTIGSLLTLRKTKADGYVTNGLSMYIDASDVTTYGSVRDITGKQTIVNHGVSTTLDNGCLNFVSSESDYIDGGFKPNLTKWSAEVYFYFKSTENGGTLLGWGASGNRTAIAIWGNDFLIAINDDTRHIIMPTAPTSLTHLVLTYNNGTIIAYVNGVKSQITTSANVMTSQASNLMVGTKYDTSTEFANINLRTFRFYDGKVLTDEEALQNYNYEINRDSSSIIKPTWKTNTKLDTNTGLEAAADKNACTDFIAYDNSYNYTLAIDTVKFVRVYYYDSSQSYIKNDSIADNFNGMINPPENTAYMRLKLNRGTAEFADLDNHVIFRKTHK